jgi:hypothetical protein
MTAIDIDPASLPPYEAITEPHVRDAVAGLDSARSSREQARKDLIELEQTRSQAEWADAEAAEQARAEGRSEPRRTHTAAHDPELRPPGVQLVFLRSAALRD